MGTLKKERRRRRRSSRNAAKTASRWEAALPRNCTMLRAEMFKPCQGRKHISLPAGKRSWSFFTPALYLRSVCDLFSCQAADGPFCGFYFTARRSDIKRLSRHKRGFKGMRLRALFLFYSTVLLTFGAGTVFRPQPKRLTCTLTTKPENRESNE